ncbi:MAG: FAD-binding oxidoreductase [Phycisphaerae bacterium]|nr:FAD-binding oxidoreductase [Gemmatimonadaceae bacterium]
MSSPSVRTLTAWGRSSSSNSHYHAPETVAALQELFLRAIGTENGARAHGFIARGYGRSYGDQCLNNAGTVVATTRLTGIRQFDATTGVIECEAGVSFAQLTELGLPSGWLPAVCPGTSYVSMGGALANDVHGKNQQHAGTFSQHVHWFDLLLPSGELTRVSRESHGDLFRATVSGIGLTGIIVAVQMQLQRLPSNAFRMTESRIPSLDAFLEMLPEASERNHYAVGWIDALTSGKHMGRGVMEVAEHAETGVAVARRRQFDWPVDCPGWMLNRASIGAFNAAYYHRVPKRGRSRAIHAAQFLYPLDAIHNWNRLYGKHGVYQFQCAMPFDESRKAIAAIMQQTVASHRASFLAVIKCMGRPGEGLLSFSRSGFSLALDFPRGPESLALVHRLHDIVLHHGGAVYLAKDACLTPDQFHAMYPSASEFRAILDRLDPARVMQSDMARRVGLR